MIQYRFPRIFTIIRADFYFFVTDWYLRRIFEFYRRKKWGSMAVLSASAVVSTAPGCFQNEVSSQGAGCADGLSCRAGPCSASLRRNTNDTSKKSSVHATCQRLHRLSRWGSFIWLQWDVPCVFLQPVLLNCVFRGIIIEGFRGSLLEQFLGAMNRA